MKKTEIINRALKQNLEKLESFCAVAKLGSISRATSQVSLSQSALSHLISNLEGALEIQLFKRRSHGLDLTEEGHVLLEFTNRLFLDLETLSTRLQDGAGAITSARVGTHETLAAHIWPKIIYNISQQTSTLKISLLSGRVDSLIKMLLHGDLHATVTVAPKSDSRLNISPLYHGKLQFFVGEKFLSGRKNLTIKEIKDSAVFTDTHAHIMQGAPITSVLRQLGIYEMDQFEVSSFEAAISLAEMNLGIAVIPDQNAERAVSEKRIRPIHIKGVSDSELLEYKICLATCKNFRTEHIHEVLLKSFK